MRSGGLSNDEADAPEDSALDPRSELLPSLCAAEVRAPSPLSTTSPRNGQRTVVPETPSTPGISRFLCSLFVSSPDTSADVEIAWDESIESGNQAVPVPANVEGPFSLAASLTLRDGSATGARRELVDTGNVVGEDAAMEADWWMATRRRARAANSGEAGVVVAVVAPASSLAISGVDIWDAAVVAMAYSPVTTACVATRAADGDAFFGAYAFESSVVHEKRGGTGDNDRKNRLKGTQNWLFGARNPFYPFAKFITFTFLPHELER